MAPSRARNPRTPDAIRKRIQELTYARNTGAYIYRELKSEFPREYPELRTVQKLARQAREERPDTRWWSIVDADAEQARRVLPVLGELARRRVATRVSDDLAPWIVKLASAAPEMPPYEVYLMANRYLTVKIRRADATYLDAYMALELWRSKDTEMKAIADGLIPADWHSVTRYTGMAGIATGRGAAHDATISAEEGANR